MCLENTIERLEDWIMENSYCPSAYGFEGPETFSDCGKVSECEYCRIKEARDE